MAMAACSIKGRKRLRRGDYSIRANVANALGNPKRLMILDALSDGEMRAGEIVKLLDFEQPTVSRHLALLRRVGIVEQRREGKCVYYRLACSCVTGFFNCIEEVISTRLRRQQKMLSGKRGHA
jgi:ArsR family transcriptional regulator